VTPAYPCVKQANAAEYKGKTVVNVKVFALIPYRDYRRKMGAALTKTSLQPDLVISIMPSKILKAN
jgi:hypothetical protein